VESSSARQHVRKKTKEAQAVLLDKRSKEILHDDDAVREKFKRAKAAYDRLENESDDDEHGQKRKRPKGKKKKLKMDPEHEQLSAKLPAYARLATHDVSHIRF
jgi:curved DNA-binding protein CbpA